MSLIEENKPKTPDPHWQNYTKQGNKQMGKSRYLLACQSYLCALELAESLLNHAKSKLDNPDAIHLYIISCNNLADSYREVKNWQESETYLLKAYDAALEIMNGKSFPLQFKIEAYRGLRINLGHLVDFYRKIGQDSKMQEIIAQTQSQTLDFLNQF